MPRYVYAICYCSLTGDMLLFRKRTRAYFYGNVHIGLLHYVDTVYPLGRAVTHGGGMYCFPGGGAQNGYIVEEAEREFREETGINLRNYFIREYYLIRMTSYGKNVIGVFFDFSPHNLGMLHAAVAISLTKKNSSVNQYVHLTLAPLNPTIPNLNNQAQGLDYFNTMVVDDELDAVFIRPLRSFAMYFGQNIFTEWFRILVYDFMQTYPILRE